MAKAKHTILTFNMSLAPFLWRPYKRIGLFAVQQEVHTASIINLQEVHTYDMLHLLCRKLTGFHASYARGIVGPQGGLVTFARQPVATPDFMQLGGQKGILATRVDKVTVANVHLLAHTDGDWSQDSKFYAPHQAQLMQLNTLLTNSNEATILTGDFNMAQSSDLYTSFTVQGGWDDTAKRDTTPTFHSEFLPPDRVPQRIDYIFTRGNIVTHPAKRVFVEKIDGVFLSNHMGLVVELGL